MDEIPDRPTCPECAPGAADPYPTPEQDHIHLTGYGYLLFVPDHQHRDFIESIRAVAYRAGQEAPEPALSFRGDLDVTTVLEALVQARSAGGDLGRAAQLLLHRYPAWMGSDGRYRLAGPGQIDDERADQPRKLGGP